MKSLSKQLKLSWLFFKAYLKRFNKSLSSGSKKSLIGVLIGLVLLMLVGKAIYSYLTYRVLSEGIIGVYNQQNLPMTVTNLLSLPLIRVDSTGQPKPMLIKGWQVNSDATEYTVTLKDNLYWNDGPKVKASEISLDLNNVDISYPNDQTIDFKLHEPFSPFPTLLTEPIFRKNSFIGVGEYQLISEEMTQGIVTKLKLQPKHSGYLPLTIRFYPDETTLKTAFSLGEIQSILGPLEVKDYEGQPLVQVKKILTLNKVLAVFYNTKDPLLSNKNLRLALSYATPDFEGEEIAKTSLPTTSWVFNDQTRDMTQNFDTAKSYLEKAHLEKDSQIILTVNSNLEQTAQEIAANWKKVGIPVAVRVESGVPQSFQALLMAQPIPPDPDQYGLWHSTQQKTNISHYSSPRIDRDLEEGRKTTDADKRKEFYQDFQKVLIDDAPATFLYFPKVNVVYRNKLTSDLQKLLSLQFPQ